MKKLFLLLFVLMPLLLTRAQIGDDVDNIVQSPSFTWAGQIGGLYLPSEGTIKVLLIFAQFPDDSYDGSSSWQLEQAPANMNGWVDENWSTNPTQGSLTDYFNVMSLNKLKFTGKSFSVTTPNTRQWYLNNGKNLGDVNKEIIQQLDASLDFAQFDSWHCDSNYTFTNTPDGIVEMVIVIYRNIYLDMPSAKDDLYGRWGALRGSNFTVDGGVRTIKTDYGGGGGGATICDWYTADMFRFSIHEFAHYLLGNNEYHNGFGFWAMLSGYEPRSYMINSYERYRLGWGNIMSLSNTGSNMIDAPLTDFITTGKAYRIEIDAATNQYFYIENHQKLSYWDKCSGDTYPDDKGIFIMRQDREYSSNWMSANWMWMIPADGRYNWTVNQYVYPSYYPAGVPVFKKLEKNYTTGYHELQTIPFTYLGIPKSPFEVLFLEDPVTGLPVEHTARNGFGLDAFRVGYNTNFDPWSNPNNQKVNQNSSNIGVKVKSINGSSINIDIYRDCNEYNITRDATLTRGIWHITQNVTVNSGATFTIQDGAVLDFAASTSLTVNGTLNIEENFTIPTGVTLILNQGAKLNFFNGSSLIVNGLLISNGTTTNKVTFDFISKNSTAQNGIKVNTGASLYVSNSVIKNGWYGIYCNNTYTSSISNWEITGCNTGIYFYNTNIGISNNYIHANNMGIALYNSSPTLTQNKIADNSNYGISSSGSTSIPKFGSSGTQGKNKITGNGVGVCAFSNSLPMLGNNSPLNGGYNTLGENTSYNIYAITSGIMFAINNYWGNILPAPPASSKIWISNGVILYSPYLSSDPTGLNKVAPLAEDAQLVLLKKAMDLIEQNDLLAAREICLDIVNNYSDSYVAFNALSLLSQTFDANEKETTKSNYKTLFNKDKKKLNAVAGLILAELDKENKLKNIDEVISKHKGDAIVEDALFAKFLYYYNDIQDNENARLVSNELDKLFPNSVSNIVAHQHLGDKDYLQKEYSFAKTEQEQKQNIVTSPIPEEYNLFANYPNPFNPVTVIKYALPFASNVNITVYNTLGQIVKEYVEGTKEAGYYTVNFDGENLSSGVYLYSINAVSANGKQNFNATKKMILMK